MVNNNTINKKTISKIFILQLKVYVTMANCFIENQQSVNKARGENEKRENYKQKTTNNEQMEKLHIIVSSHSKYCNFFSSFFHVVFNVCFSYLFVCTLELWSCNVYGTERIWALLLNYCMKWCCMRTNKCSLSPLHHHKFNIETLNRSKSSRKWKQRKKIITNNSTKYANCSLCT